MTDKIILFNPEQTPTVYSADGRTVPGAGRVTVSRLDEAGERAVAAGLLRREAPPRPEHATTEQAEEPADKSSSSKGDPGASSPARRR